MAVRKAHRKALRAAGRLTGIALAATLAAVASTGLFVSAVRASPASITVSLAGSQPETVAAGDTITYTLTLANSGVLPSGPVTIVALMPNDTMYVTGTASCGSVPNCSVAANQPPANCPSGGLCPVFPPTITWTLNSVAAGASGLVLTVEVGIVAEEPGPLVDSATWTGGGCSTSPGCSTNQVSNPVMNVGVSLLPTPLAGATLKAGDIVQFTVDVFNSGTGPTDVPLLVFDDIWSNDAAAPPPWTYVAASATCGSVPGCSVTVGPAECLLPGSVCLGSDIEWTIASVPAQTTNFDLSYSLQVASTASGSIGKSLQWGALSPEPPAFVPSGEVDPFAVKGDGCVFLIGPETVECESDYVGFSVSSPPSPIPRVTSIPTGEPWAGAGPYEIALGGIGVTLICSGTLRRRRVTRS